MKKKLYVLVRKDLSKSQQAVQACHAVAEYLKRGYPLDWDNGTMVLLGVRDLNELEAWFCRFNNATMFYEDDPVGASAFALVGDEETEIATRELRLL
jgi:hypothetical protein